MEEGQLADVTPVRVRWVGTGVVGKEYIVVMGLEGRKGEQLNVGIEAGVAREAGRQMMESAKEAYRMKGEGGYGGRN